MPTWEIQPLAASEEPLQLWMAWHSHSSSVISIPAKSDALSSEHALYIPALVSLYMDYPTLSQSDNIRLQPDVLLFCSLPQIVLLRQNYKYSLSLSIKYLYSCGIFTLHAGFVYADLFHPIWISEKGPSLTHLLHLQHSAYSKQLKIQ